MVSPPDELTASPTGTRDFSLFSKRAEPLWTGPEHSRQTETDEAREKEGVTSQHRGNNTAKDGQWHTLRILGGVILHFICPISLLLAD